MHAPSEDNASARTLYVGNLDPSITEELLMVLFSQIGPCKSCKIIHEATSDPYAFIEFVEHQGAVNALLAMNKRLVMGKEIKVNWATTSTTSTISKADTSKHHHIFVGDISPEMDQNALFEAFSPFGEISEIKIAKFPDTQKSKGYCFIAFTNQHDAETAIASMNGQWLGTRKIRTNWASRKVAGNDTVTNSKISQFGQGNSAPKLDYNETWNRTGETNSTVYFGGCADATEEFIRSLFSPFGHIQEIRVFKDKGYAFIRFASKDSACRAICNLHGSDIHGNIAKCGWGRDESINDRNSATHHGASNTMNNQAYNQNQFDFHSQNSYRSPNDYNKYMGNDRGGYNSYGGEYQQPNYYQQQYQNSQQWNNNMNSPSFNSTNNAYSQSTNNSSGWNNNNNNNYGQNFNQYNNSQQSRWNSSRR